MALNTLRSLSRQTFPSDHFEVIVVADGCSDDTETCLLEQGWPFELTVLSEAPSRAGAARNRGAAAARGSLLAFMDDDIEVSPRWLEAHRSAHQGRSRLVSVGYLAVPAEAREDFFHIELRYWWEAMFFPLRDPSYRFAYTNLTSGNFSIGRDLFEEVGGFRTDLPCHEDYELGYRLIQHDGDFLFNQAAWGWHHDQSNLDRSLERKFEEGVADVCIGSWYPELRPGLMAVRLFSVSALVLPLLIYLTFQAPRLAAVLVSLARRSLVFLERFRARSIWRLVLNGILAHGYCLGLKSQLGSYRALRAFIESPPGEPRAQQAASLDVDLELGTDAASRQLDELRPSAARLFYGGTFLGTVPALPGAEPVLGRHLKGILIQRFAREMTLRLMKNAATAHDEFSPARADE
jgi:GT2 family glycosyltransferase